METLFLLFWMEFYNSLIIVQHLPDCKMFISFLCSDKSYMAKVVDFLQDAYSGNKAEDKDKILWVKFEQCSSKGKGLQ